MSITLSGTMVISCLVNIVQGGGGGKFYIGLGCSKIRQKRSSVSLLLKPIAVIPKKPNRIILHVGTNNLTTDEANVVTDKICNVCQHIEDNLPECEIDISELTPQRDSPTLDSTRKEVNKALKAFCRTRDWTVITHNTQDSGLNSRGLHLNHRGTASFAHDFNTYIKGTKQ